MTTSILEASERCDIVIMLVVMFFLVMVLVIHREMICRYGETLLCSKLPQRFSCETWLNNAFIRLPRLRYIYVAYRQLKIP